ncbi:heat-shock protein [Dechloromonas denitrificans]|uniref:Heat-shock protein n=1 Tax=Dechloromonas denitrificans TaxID=281362 RepID=A0A133XP40_9RHOO|nr:Hsp20/alpha crystallin family protein [Dechloromonas denitrificans]KXB32702.1 heat-shock protein [Dechloromonas denitrificans]
MLENLKETGKSISQEISRAWDLLSDGWREIFNRSSNALTHFSGGKDMPHPAGNNLLPYPRWSLLAGEIEESGNEFIVRLEVPGMDKENCQVRIEGNRLILSGEKQLERSSETSSYHVMERAYGAFQRIIPLPGSVIEDKAEASYRNGVLTVRLLKRGPETSMTIPVS